MGKFKLPIETPTGTRTKAPTRPPVETPIRALEGNPTLPRIGRREATATPFSTQSIRPSSGTAKSLQARLFGIEGVDQSKASQVVESYDALMYGLGDPAIIGAARAFPQRTLSHKSLEIQRKQNRDLYNTLTPKQQELANIIWKSTGSSSEITTASNIDPKIRVLIDHARFLDRITKGRHDGPRLEDGSINPSPMVPGGDWTLEFVSTSKNPKPPEGVPEKMQFQTEVKARKQQLLLDALPGGQDAWKVVPPTTSEYHIAELDSQTTPWKIPTIDSDGVPYWLDVDAQGKTVANLIDASLAEGHRLIDMHFNRDIQPGLEKYVLLLEDLAKQAESKGEQGVADGLRQHSIDARREVQGLQGANLANVKLEKWFSGFLRDATNPVVDAINVMLAPMGWKLPPVNMLNPLGKVLGLIRRQYRDMTISGPGTMLNRRFEIPVQVLIHTGKKDLGKVAHHTILNWRNRSQTAEVMGMGPGTLAGADPYQGMTIGGLHGKVTMFFYRRGATDAAHDSVDLWLYKNWRDGDRPRFMINADDAVRRQMSQRRMQDQAVGQAQSWQDLLVEYNSGHADRMTRADLEGKTLPQIELEDARLIFGEGNVVDMNASGPDVPGSVEDFYESRKAGMVPLGGELERRTYQKLSETTFPHTPGGRIPIFSAHPIMAQMLLTYKAPQWEQLGNLARASWPGLLLRYPAYRVAYNGMGSILQTLGPAIRLAGYDEPGFNDMVEATGGHDELMKMFWYGEFSQLEMDRSGSVDGNILGVEHSAQFFGWSLDVDAGFGWEVAAAVYQVTMGSNIPLNMGKMVGDVVKAPEGRKIEVAVSRTGIGRAVQRTYATLTNTEPIGSGGKTQTESEGLITDVLHDDGTPYKVVILSEMKRQQWIKQVNFGHFTPEQKKSMLEALDYAPFDKKFPGSVPVDAIKPLLPDLSLFSGMGPDLAAKIARDTAYTIRRQQAAMQSYIENEAVKYAKEFQQEHGQRQAGYHPMVELQTELKLQEILANFWTSKRYAGEPPFRPQNPNGYSNMKNTTEGKELLKKFKNTMNRANGVPNEDQ